MFLSVEFTYTLAYTYLMFNGRFYPAKMKVVPTTLSIQEARNFLINKGEDSALML